MKRLFAIIILTVGLLAACNGASSSPGFSTEPTLAPSSSEPVLPSESPSMAPSSESPSSLPSSSP